MNPTTTSHATLIAEVTALRASLGDAVELVETLRADRDALRAALTSIAELEQCDPSDIAVRVARAALGRSA